MDTEPRPSTPSPVLPDLQAASSQLLYLYEVTASGKFQAGELTGESAEDKLHAHIHVIGAIPTRG
jgi:hypothetical protein